MKIIGHTETKTQQKYTHQDAFRIRLGDGRILVLDDSRDSDASEAKG